ncbi:MAG: hypothetical protein ABI450_12555 [Rhizomicrobium sp.]
MSSAEQLVELRKARDRYKTLADSFRKEGDALAARFQDEGDPLIVMEEKLKQEQDAQRIANAYEKSIANIVASSEAMRQAQTLAPSGRSLGVRLIALAIFLIAAGAIVLFVMYPGIYRQALVYLPTSWGITGRGTPAPVVTETSTRVPSVSVTPPPVAEKELPKPAQQQRAPVIHTIPPKKAKALDPAARDEGGFSAKVLQPDGTFKEQYFSVKPRR